MIIAVIGESNARPHIAKLEEEVGRELARRKIDLVCGGMGGVMEAACRHLHHHRLRPHRRRRKTVRAANNRKEAFERSRLDSGKDRFGGFS